ncbi:MAG: reverse transcriptase family protein [Planctomycetaceae bacterium]
MGLFSLLKRLLFGSPAPSGTESATPLSTTTATNSERRYQRLSPLRYRSSLVRTERGREQVTGKQPPYPFAQRLPIDGYLDLSQDGDPRWLQYYNVPSLSTPQNIAAWLEVPVGKLAWLTYRFCENNRPQSAKESHYHFRWLRKRTGGHRLIESPKGQLRQVQQRILREILDRVPPHAAAHGFVRGRSIVTNATPHVGKSIVIKFDLDNFYPSVRYSRVVAIFRTLGYSREAALWLARLCTSAAPGNLKLPLGESTSIWKYMPRHLPQGACTSPALANLSAYALDVRLSALARVWHVEYTRYADDLTFSGDGKFGGALREFIPLVQQIIRSEGFQSKLAKRRVVRASQRQTVTGVVVNEKLNVSRQEFDRLKATLFNCVKHGPSTQNHDSLKNFSAHLRGRIAHVVHVSPARGTKLLALYQQIDWNR